MLPLMYIFEMSDILFLIKNLKNLVSNFDTNDYVSFSTGATRSSGIKLRHNKCTTKYVISILTELVACGTLYQSLISVYLSVQLSNVSKLIFGNTSR